MFLAARWASPFQAQDSHSRHEADEERVRESGEGFRREVEQEEHGDDVWWFGWRF